MAMQTGASPVKGKLKGLAAASKSLVGKPIEIPGGRLPSGINNGVAVLHSVGLGVYPQDFKTEDYRGKPCFRAAAVAKSPAEHGGQHVRGTQFYLTEPLFDTPKAGGKRKTAADHVNFMREKLMGFGLDYDGLVSSLPDNASDDQAAAVIEAGCNALTPSARRAAGAEPVYFRFRTWLGKPPTISGPDAGGKWTIEDFKGKRAYSSKELLLKANPYAESDPMVNVDWQGAVPFSENGEAPAAVEDNTGEVGEAAGEETSAEGEATTDESGEDGGEATEAPNYDAMTVEELAAAAKAFNDDDSIPEGTANEAAARLLDIAEGFGIRDAVDGSDSWEAGLALIQEAQAAAEGGGEETPDESRVPAKGEVWRYALPDPKNPKKRGKKIEVIVESANAAKGIATLRNNTTKAMIVGGKDKKPIAVPFAELEPPE